jgi:hypothetical protein
MSEKELGKALLNLDSRQLAAVPDVREQTWKILECDRRRVRRWTVLSVALWAAAILMVLLMLILYGLVFPLQAKLAGYEEVSKAAAERQKEFIDLDNLTPQQRDEAKFKAQIMFQMVTVGVTVSVGILGLAAISTVFLVLASRRATLRQINASLLEISQQLKSLQPPSSSANS